MAYETGTATGPEDLLDKLFTFAATNGWTINEATTGSQGHMTRGTISLGFYYTSSILKLYPSTGYTSTSPVTLPDVQAGVAYNDTLATTNTGITVNEMTGPYDAYYFFESDTYMHVVVLTNNNRYRHFGCGLMVQAGSFNGGAYFTGHDHSQNASYIGNPDSGEHMQPYSGYTPNTGTYQGMWVHGRKATSPETALSGAPHADTKWYAARNPNYTDGDGVEVGELQISGTMANRSASVLSVGPSLFNGFTPLVPINLFINDDTPTSPTTPEQIYPLGSVPDVRCVNIQGFTDGQQVTIGSDIWFVFPVSKRGIDVTSPLEERTGNHGLAYKKVVA